jgi:mono/diheme cytochrome c family protein
MRPALTLLVALAAAPCAAEPDPRAGAELYAQHCAVCHGARADGTGPQAATLSLQPPDLTTLAARHAGVFPLERVVMRIDGRQPLVAHGSPMPVFGPFFEGDRAVALKTDAGQPVLVSQPVADLTVWLMTIQHD